jgi:hypothetical protein
MGGVGSERVTFERTEGQPLAVTDGVARTVRRGAAYLADGERRLAPYFERAEPQRRARA